MSSTILTVSSKHDMLDAIASSRTSSETQVHITAVWVMQITFLTRKFRNVGPNLHCDVAHIITIWVSTLTPDCNGVFAINASGEPLDLRRGCFGYVTAAALLLPQLLVLLLSGGLHYVAASVALVVVLLMLSSPQLLQLLLLQLQQLLLTTRRPSVVTRVSCR